MNMVHSTVTVANHVRAIPYLIKIKCKTIVNTLMKIWLGYFCFLQVMKLYVLSYFHFPQFLLSIFTH